MADLVTLNDYKAAEGINSPKDDSRLNFIIPSVSQLVKTYCANSFLDFYSTNKVEVFSMDWDSYAVQLTESPVNNIVSVETRDQPSAAYTTLPSDKWYYESTTDSVVSINGNVYANWPRGVGSVKVTYTAGYSSTPADLQIAVIDLINYYFKDEHKTRRTLQGATMENAPSGDGRGFPDHIKRVLDMYKNF